MEQTAVTAPVESAGADAKPVEGGSAPETGEAGKQTEVKTDPGKVKLKIDGQEIEVTNDELIRLAQKGKAADGRMQEAATVRKQVAQLIESLKSNPFEVIEKMGLNARELTEKWLYDKIQYEQKPEEERRALEAEMKAQTLQEELDNQKKTVEEQKMAQMAEHYRQEYEKQIIDSLEKSKLPRTEGTVRRIADYMYRGIEKGILVSAEDATKLVEEDLSSEMATLFSKLDDEKIKQLATPDIINKIARATLTNDTNRVGKEGQVQGNGKKSVKKMAWKDFTKQLDEMIK